MLSPLLTPLVVAAMTALPGPPTVRSAAVAPVTSVTFEAAGSTTARAGVVALARSAAAVGVAAATGPVLSSRSTTRPRGKWVWPLRPEPAVIRGFEPPPRPWADGHRGVDLAGGLGQVVRAAGDGVVGFSGVIAGRGVVTVRHAGGWRTTYEPVDERVAEGTQVVAGQPIGRLAGGPANHCAPRVCLHWGAVTGAADYHDPLVLLGLGHPVLLPLLPS